VESCKELNSGKLQSLLQILELGGSEWNKANTLAYYDTAVIVAVSCRKDWSLPELSSLQDFTLMVGS
jgi:hypothetical protein